MPHRFTARTETPARTLTHGEKQLYLDRILPTVYAELYMLRAAEKHQVLTALRQELMYWGGLENTGIESRMVDRG